MRKNYLNPEAVIMAFDHDDILTTSNTGVFTLGNVNDNEDGGFKDAKSFGEMFNS